MENNFLDTKYEKIKIHDLLRTLAKKHPHRRWKGERGQNKATAEATRIQEDFGTDNLDDLYQADKLIRDKIDYKYRELLERFTSNGMVFEKKTAIIIRSENKEGKEETNKRKDEKRKDEIRKKEEVFE